MINERSFLTARSVRRHDRGGLPGIASTSLKPYAQPVRGHFRVLVSSLWPFLAAPWAVAAEQPSHPQGPMSPVTTPSQLPKAIAPSPQAAPDPGGGEVPADIVAKMRADLAQQIGGRAAAARVVRAEAVTWADGGLGCAEPGQLYTQATVPGYRVDFEAAGGTYTYHASANGVFKLCRALSRHALRKKADG
jgi:hypothetical protein